MKLIKPNFWGKRFSILSILLYPFTLLIIFFIYLKKKLTKVKTFKIPVICIGNIYIGGTGKTPTSISIAKELSNFGFKVSIIRKYYKEHQDEYNLIKNEFHNLVLSNDRGTGIKEAEKNNFDIVILDDGLQDYKIKKDFSIVCFNQNQLIGNGLVLPSGPLREPLNTLKKVKIVLINGEKDTKFEKKLLKINTNLKFFYSYYKPLNIDKFKNKKLLALAGIGNPENFFGLLEKNNLLIEKKLIFPDHYQFTKKEIKNIIKTAEQKNLKIIMTEKDYYKINNYVLDKVDYLKVSLEIKNKNELINKIKMYV